MTSAVFTRTLCLYTQAVPVIAPLHWDCRDGRRRIRAARQSAYFLSKSIALAARAARDDIFRFFLTRAHACISQTLIERAKDEAAPRAIQTSKISSLQSLASKAIVFIQYSFGPVACYGLWLRSLQSQHPHGRGRSSIPFIKVFKDIGRGRVKSLRVLAFPYPSPSHAHIFFVRWIIFRKGDEK